MEALIRSYKVDDNTFAQKIRDLVQKTSSNPGTLNTAFALAKRRLLALKQNADPRLAKELEYLEKDFAPSKNVKDFTMLTPLDQYRIQYKATGDLKWTKLFENSTLYLLI